MFLKIFFALTLVSLIWAYPSGAPARSCGRFVPMHDIPPKPEEFFPFEMFASRAYYNVESAQNITVTIKSKREDQFIKGFVIFAKNIRNEHFGTWYIDDNTEAKMVPHCEFVAITHINPRPKREITLTWLPLSAGPSPPADFVNFRATVVQDYENFWTNMTVPVKENNCRT